MQFFDILFFQGILVHLEMLAAYLWPYFSRGENENDSPCGNNEVEVGAFRLGIFIFITIMVACGNRTVIYYRGKRLRSFLINERMMMVIFGSMQNSYMIENIAQCESIQLICTLQVLYLLTSIRKKKTNAVNLETRFGSP